MGRLGERQILPRRSRPSLLTPHQVRQAIVKRPLILRADDFKGGVSDPIYVKDREGRHVRMNSAHVHR